MTAKPSKAVMAALEKVFAAEIDAAIHDRPFRCFQSKAKIYQKLAEDGIVHWTETRLSGRFPVTVAGWELTSFGHFLYRTFCEDDNPQKDTKP